MALSSEILYHLIWCLNSNWDIAISSSMSFTSSKFALSSCCRTELYLNSCYKSYHQRVLYSIISRHTLRKYWTRIMKIISFRSTQFVQAQSWRVSKLILLQGVYLPIILLLYIWWYFLQFWLHSLLSRLHTSQHSREQLPQSLIAARCYISVPEKDKATFCDIQ